MEIIIDQKSGFCFGVKRAIELAEIHAKNAEKLYCLGEIVHNSEEVNRLKNLGVNFIDRETFFTLSNCKVLFRAHGEPPEIYQYAKENQIEIIDATCTVVLKLQEKIRMAESLMPETQIVIYGKKNHPEVVGLRGQVDNTIVVESVDELETIDFSKPVSLFAQTTKDRTEYQKIKSEIESRLTISDGLKVTNSICGQVANRAPWLTEFSQSVNALIFVGGKNSSNSKMLFEVCKQHNPNSFFVTSVQQLSQINLPKINTLGITGATSTPSWLIEQVARHIREKMPVE